MLFVAIVTSTVDQGTLRSRDQTHLNPDGVMHAIGKMRRWGPGSIASLLCGPMALNMRLETWTFQSKQNALPSIRLRGLL